MNINSTDLSMTAVHRFEAAGLGKGPFRYQGCFRSKDLTSCHHCSTAIRIVHLIKSSDGRVFRVGSDCVEYLFDGYGSIVSDAKISRKSMERTERSERAASIRRERARLRRLTQFRAARELVSQIEPSLRSMLRQHRKMDIVASFRARVATGSALTERQVQVLREIHSRETVVRAEVPAGDGRREIRGTLMSVKWVESLHAYNKSTCKIRVRVTTTDGCYELYGTAPTGLFDSLIQANNERFEAWRALPRDGDPVEAPEDRTLKNLIGQPVGFHAKIERSVRDPSFGFFSRPTKGWIEIPD